MKRLLLLVGYVTATALSVPQRIGGELVDWGLLLGPASVACLLLAIRELSPAKAFGVGLAAGGLAHALVVYWIYIAEGLLGGAGPLAGGIALVVVSTYLATSPALFSAAARGLVPGSALAPLLLAALWTSLDHLRSFALTGFPYSLLGYSQSDNGWLLGLAPWTGAYGLGFAATAAGAGFASAATRNMRGMVVGLGAYAALTAVGAVYLRLESVSDTPRVRLAVLQGNIPQDVKWKPDWEETTIRVYERLTRAAAWDGAKIVVWPETSVPRSPEIDPLAKERLARLARETGVTLVVGAVGVEGYDAARDRQTAPVIRYFDSAFVISPDGAFLHRYDKSWLVPFGEYLPLRALFGRFLSPVATGRVRDDISAGAGPRVLVIPPLGEDAPVGVPICYELMFPDVARRFVHDGARVLLALSNDGWYGKSGAADNLLLMSRLRAAETRTWIARAANTGISALIDARGRVRQELGLNQRGYLVGELGIRGDPPSFYARFGDVFALSCWALTLSLLGVRLVRSVRSG